MNAQTLDNNSNYTLCGRKVKMGNGFMQQFEVYQHEETSEYVIERTMFRNDEIIDFSQSEAMNAEQAQTLWKMYTVH